MKTSIIAFHGSGSKVEQFDFKFTNKGHDQMGSGFYFTTSAEDAFSYCFKTREGMPDKLGGSTAPAIHVCQLNFDGLIAVNDARSFSKAAATQIIMASPQLSEDIYNWGDPSSEPVEKIVARAAETYSKPELLDAMFSLANDFYSDSVQAFNENLAMYHGIDGIVSEFDDHQHYVTLLPRQIEILGVVAANEHDAENTIRKAMDIAAAVGLRPESSRRRPKP